MAANEIKVKLTVEGNAKKEIVAAAKSVDDFAKSAKKSLSGATQAFATFAGVVGAQIFTKAIGTAFDASKKLFNLFIVDGIKAAQVQEDAINQLNTALKASGIFTDEVSQSLQNYASELQATTKFGDEAILQTQGLIQSLGQLDEKGLKRATKATLDLSAALGIDLNAAALLVGKAAAGEVSSFSRYGLVIKKGADNADTFAKALDAINDKFGGAAAAQIETFSGAVAQVSNLFGDLQETIGEAITKNEVIIAVFNEFGQVLGGLQNGLTTNKEGLRDFVNNGVIFAIQSLGFFVEAIQTVQVWLLTLYKAVLTVKAGYIGLDAFIRGGMDAAVEATAKTAEEVIALERQIKEIENGEGSLQVIIDKVKELEEVAVETAEKEVERQEVAEEQHERKLARTDELTDAELERKEAVDKKVDSIVQASKTEQELLDEQFRFILKDKNRRLLSTDKLYKAEAALLKKQHALDKKAKDNQEKFDETNRNKALQGTSQFFGNLSSLQSSKSKELFEIGKAAAIAQTITDTYRGAQGAFTSLSSIPFVGPALGIAAAASAIIAGMVRVNQIRSQQFQAKEGITDVPGPRGAGDIVPALLSPGERVVDAGTNEGLKSFLGEQAGTRSILNSINENLQNLNNQVVVNVGGEEIVNELLDQQRAGRSLEVA